MSFGITITVKNADKIMSGFARGIKTAVIAKPLSIYARAMGRAIQANAPVKTGKLKASIKAVQVGPLEWQIQEGVWYGQLQRTGTTKKNYPIYPREKKALYWPGLDHPIAYVKSHPGFKANNYADVAIQGATAKAAMSVLQHTVGIDIANDLLGGSKNG